MQFLEHNLVAQHDVAPACAPWYVLHQNTDMTSSHVVQHFKDLQKKMKNADRNFALHPRSTILPEGFRPPMLKVHLQHHDEALAADLEHQRVQLKAGKKAATKRAQREALAGSDGAAAARAGAAAASKNLSTLERRSKSILAHGGSKPSGALAGGMGAKQCASSSAGWQGYMAAASGGDVAQPVGAGAGVSKSEPGEHSRACPAWLLHTL